MAKFLPAKRVLPVLLAIAGVSLLLAELKLEFHPKDPFYVSYYRMWELALGAALAVWPPFLLSPRFAAFVTAAGLLAITCAVTVYDTTTPFPGLTALLPCVGAAFIIAGGSSPNAISRVLALRPFVFVGLISYSLYLIHWPLFSFAHLYVYDTLSVELRLLIVIASVVLAYLSSRYIETPFRRKSSGARVVLVRGAAFAGAFSLVGMLFASFAGFPFRADDSQIVRAVNQDGGEESGGLAETLAMLKTRKVTTAILGQVPDYTVSVSLCVAHARFQKRDETRCVMQSAASVKSRFQFVEDYFQHLRQHYEFTLFDPLPAFCDGERCSATDSGTFLMADSNHLTEAGSYRLLPYLNIPGLPYHPTKEALADGERSILDTPSVGSN